MHYENTKCLLCWDQVEIPSPLFCQYQQWFLGQAFITDVFFDETYHIIRRLRPTVGFLVDIPCQCWRHIWQGAGLKLAAMWE